MNNHLVNGQLLKNRPERPQAIGADLLKIGELARSAGKTVRTIRLYEELGLLSPARRSSGGFRLYDQEALDRIKLIDSLQRLGFSLPSIKEIVESWKRADSPAQAMVELRSVYDTKLSETQRSIQALRHLEEELMASLEFLDRCEPCEKTATPAVACRDCGETLPLIRGLSRD